MSNLQVNSNVNSNVNSAGLFAHWSACLWMFIGMMGMGPDYPEGDPLGWVVTQRIFDLDG